MLPSSYEDYAQLASDWFWQMDAELRCTALSGHFEAMTGRIASACIGRRRSDVAANAHDRAFWEAHEEDLARRRPFRGFQYPVDHPDGCRRWLRISGDPIFDEDGTFLGYRGIATDVTAERDARDALLEQKQQIDAALSHLPQGVVMTDAAERVVLCNDRYFDLLGLSRSILRAGLTMPELVAHSVAAGHYPGETVETIMESRGRRLADRRPGAVIQRLADSRTVEIQFSPVSGGGWVTTYEDVSTRHAAETALREKTAWFHATIETMAQGICMFDRDMQLVVCNQHFAGLLGLTESLTRPGTAFREILAHGVSARLHTGSAPEAFIAERIARAAENRPFAEDLRMSDGRVIALTHRPMPDGAWVATFEDMTDRRVFEQQLAEQGRRLDVALESMPAGLCLFDSQARLAVWNRRYEEIYGLSAGQLYEGISHREIVELGVGLGRHRSGRTVEEIHAERMAMVRGERPGPYHQHLADGRIIEIICRPAPQDGWVATYEDVTERLCVERHVKEQNELFDAALAHMSHGLLMVDADDRVVLINPKFKEFYRLSPDSVAPGMPMRQIIEQSVAAGNFPGMSASEIFDRRRQRLALAKATTFRQTLPGGRILDIHFTPLSDGRGWVTVYDDVTEQANADARVVEQNGRFDAALNNMAEGLLMLDRDLRVIVCNERYRDIFRLPAELARPGTSLTDIIAFGVGQGMHPGHTCDDVMEVRRAIFALSEPATLQMALDDGRVIETCFQPMESGGWVGTYSDVTARKRAEAHIIHMARHDALTDLPNRNLFHDRLVHATASGSSSEPSAVLCLDLDRFKAVNDTLGHAVGDHLLKEVTRRLKAVLPDVAVLARLGGDEFAVFLSQAGPEAASVVAKRLVDEVCRGYEIGGHRVNVGLSVGIALAPGDGHDPDQLLRAADMALYRAKEEGRGTYRFFEHEMDARMQARRQLELDLRQALASHQFSLYYQPLVTMDTGRIAGFEALVRWHHPVRGLVGPAEFIPLAEEIGLIVPLGDWVLREACREAATWPSDVRVAVNLSPVQFRSSALVLSVVAALGAAGLNPDRLELEITEGVLLQDTKATIAILYELKGLGIHIAMDDFGTGYSSLSYLRAFPFDKIKIDRSFIADLACRTDAIAIIKAITGLGASLGMTTTAEGIETLEQLECLRGEGCHEVQGYLFSRPKPGSEVQAMLAGHEGPATLTRAA